MVILDEFMVIFYEFMPPVLRPNILGMNSSPPVLRPDNTVVTIRKPVLRADNTAVDEMTFLDYIHDFP
jgi:hypothetical protein